MQPIPSRLRAAVFALHTPPNESLLARCVPISARVFRFAVLPAVRQTVTACGRARAKRWGAAAESPRFRIGKCTERAAGFRRARLMGVLRRGACVLSPNAADRPAGGVPRRIVHGSNLKPLPRLRPNRGRASRAPNDASHQQRSTGAQRGLRGGSGARARPGGPTVSGCKQKAGSGLWGAQREGGAGDAAPQSEAVGSRRACDARGGLQQSAPRRPARAAGRRAQLRPGARARLGPGGGRALASDGGQKTDGGPTGARPVRGEARAGRGARRGIHARARGVGSAAAGRWGNATDQGWGGNRRGAAGRSGPGEQGAAARPGELSAGSARKGFRMLRRGSRPPAACARPKGWGLVYTRRRGEWARIRGAAARGAARRGAAWRGGARRGVEGCQGSVRSAARPGRARARAGSSRVAQSLAKVERRGRRHARRGAARSAPGGKQCRAGGAARAAARGAGASRAAAAADRGAPQYEAREAIGARGHRLRCAWARGVLCCLARGGAGSAAAGRPAGGRWGARSRLRIRRCAAARGGAWGPPAPCGARAAAAASRRCGARAHAQRGAARALAGHARRGRGRRRARACHRGSPIQVFGRAGAPARGARGAQGAGGAEGK